MATASHPNGAARKPRREAVQGTAYRVPTPESTAATARRLQRLDRLTWLLDRSIPIGKYRIGLDPIIGLIPGLGDWIGAMLSMYVMYEGARLGAPKRILLRMTGNILVETIIGAVPVLGDFFDFVWQANTRNLALIRAHHGAQWQSRPRRGVWFPVLLGALLVLTLIVTLSYLVFRGIMSLFQTAG
ncbi:MAG TPA: DUF4112 domain-containing protein [Lacunisphaera sp.]|nr:DUF4112 domain-containing protein [Lacunisphaera sp.]